MYEKRPTSLKIRLKCEYIIEEEYKETLGKEYRNFSKFSQIR